ncbi:hypothetical protein [Paenibacillus tundrae]|uniref:Uncharacterized protein n=1 Tax=Paenibacillus tundrae TaxID=528187 RepID=A0ABT9W8U1_9BACL|nr:hypothetical protein [Paenibacillus tundrae]MDQ0169663.1 hypothetical protein [Paenibacillus tundrae]
MSDLMKMEFEITAFGLEGHEGYSEAYRQNEIVRTKLVSRDTTLGEVEEVIKELMAEIRQEFIQPPEYVNAKVVLRVKSENGELKYLG